MEFKSISFEPTTFEGNTLTVSATIALTLSEFVDLSKKENFSRWIGEKQAEYCHNNYTNGEPLSDVTLLIELWTKLGVKCYDLYKQLDIKQDLGISDEEMKKVLTIGVIQ